MTFTGATFNGHAIGSLAPYVGHFDYVNPASLTHVLATADGLGAAGSSFTVIGHRQR